MTTRLMALLSMEPALVRSALVAVTGLIAVAVGHQLDSGWIDTAVSLYGLLAPIITGLLIRGAVSPTARQ